MIWVRQSRCQPLFARLHPAINEMLIEDLLKFISEGKFILGVCNGFQLMVKLGLLPALNGNFTEQCATLTFNDSGRFEDRWVYLKANAKSPCVFTRGIDIVYFPVRHGEGKFVPENDAVLEEIENKICTRFNTALLKAHPQWIIRPTPTVQLCHCRTL